MSAEIIQFGKPKSVTIKGRVPNSSIGKRRTVGRRLGEKASARFMFDGDLYHADFCGDEMVALFAVQYRISAGGVQEMKRSFWWRGNYGRFNPDPPKLAEAARSARAKGSDDMMFRDAAITQLRERHAKLVSEVAKIEATIASMQGELN